jgi:hypothetical protein
MRRILSVVLALVAMLVSGATSASATPGDGIGGTTSDGYSAKAVTFSGDAAPSGGGAIPVYAPATCWWEPAQLSRLDGSYADPTNADQLETWYKVDLPALINASFVIYREGYGDWTSWQPSLDKIRAGQKITAYTPHCRDGAPGCPLNAFSGIAVPPVAGLTDECGVAIGIGFFVTGNPPPAQVDPADLAQVASKNMDIPDPVVDRNPKVTALTGATLVSLPTWFWVTDPTSVGGAAGTRTIRAEVDGVWAEVVASTDGLHLTSPAGGKDCGPGQALTHYAMGVNESSACTVSFARSSVGYPIGFPVDASTSWSAEWTGSGNTGGALAALQRGSVVDVPVAEVQTLVTDAG